MPSENRLTSVSDAPLPCEWRSFSVRRLKRKSRGRVCISGLHLISSYLLARVQHQRAERCDARVRSRLARGSLRQHRRGGRPHARIVRSPRRRAYHRLRLSLHYLQRQPSLARAHPLWACVSYRGNQHGTPSRKTTSDYRAPSMYPSHFDPQPPNAATASTSPHSCRCPRSTVSPPVSFCGGR